MVVNNNYMVFFVDGSTSQIQKAIVLQHCLQPGENVSVPPSYCASVLLIYIMFEEFKFLPPYQL